LDDQVWIVTDKNYFKPFLTYSHQVKILWKPSWYVNYNITHNKSMWIKTLTKPVDCTNDVLKQNYCLWVDTTSIGYQNFFKPSESRFSGKKLLKSLAEWTFWFCITWLNEFDEFSSCLFTSLTHYSSKQHENSLWYMIFFNLLRVSSDLLGLY